jgi:hypothetical protein
MRKTTGLGVGVYAVLLMPALVGLPLRQELPFYAAALGELIIAVVVAAHVLSTHIRQALGPRARAWGALSTIATTCVALLQLMAFAALIGRDTPGVHFVSNLVRLDPAIVQGTLVVLLAAFLSMLGLTWPLVLLDAVSSSAPKRGDENAHKNPANTHNMSQSRRANNRRAARGEGRVGPAEPLVVHIRDSRARSPIRPCGPGVYRGA